jgi:deazaflavin-dependent oxidoreductase (nitroreductase family)
MTEPAYPPLLPPPAPSGGTGPAWRLSRTAFRYLNRWAVVPFHRAGLSAWLGTPVAGCQLLLTTTGRTSHLPRHTPLGYLVADGAAWVMAGYGPSTLWYRNLVAEPRVEVLLPARPSLRAVADEVLDPAIRARIIPPLVRSMRLPGAIIGADPGTATDEAILELTAWVPLIRLRPEDGDLEPGPDDPGGLGWVWRQAVVALGSVALLRAFRRLGRRRPRTPDVSGARRGR